MASKSKKTVIQSLHLNKNYFPEEEDARYWAMTNHFSLLYPEHSKNWWRYRQHMVERFVENSFFTKVLEIDNDGSHKVRAIKGTPKKGEVSMKNRYRRNPCSPCGGMEENPKQIVLSQDEQQNIVNLYQAGYTLEDIVEIHENEFSVTFLSNLLNEHGIPVRGRGKDRFKRSKSTPNMLLRRLKVVYEQLLQEIDLDELLQLHVDAVQKIEEEDADNDLGLLSAADDDDEEWEDEDEDEDEDEEYEEEDVREMVRRGMRSVGLDRE